MVYLLSHLKVDAARDDRKKDEVRLEQRYRKNGVEHGQGGVETEEPYTHEHQPTQQGHVEKPIGPDVILKHAGEAVSPGRVRSGVVSRHD